ncbi:MAG: PAS domain S-box protein [Polyangiaceae bacterium]
MGVYRHESAEAQHVAEEELGSVSRLKVEQIDGWLGERRGDVEIARTHPILRRLLADPVDIEARGQATHYFELLRHLYGYAEIALFDADARPVLVLPAGGLEGRPCVNTHAAETLKSPKVTFTDLHRTAPDGPLRIALGGSVEAEGATTSAVVGAVLLTIDPDRFLFPLLQRWPVPSDTAEAVLVRRDGDDVIALSPLRFRPNAVLELRVPLTRLDVPAVRAVVLGQRGALMGMDYRGEPVLSVATAVPDTPWIVLAKMDQNEVRQSVRDEGIAITGLTALAALCVLLGTVAVWRQHTLRLTRRAMDSQAAAESQLRRSEAQLSDALRLANAANWEYDVERDEFTFNDNFYSLLHTTADAVGGYTLSSSEYARRFCHPEDAPLVGKEVEAAIRSEEPSHESHVEHRILYADGGVGYVSVKIIAIKDEQGRTVRTRGVNQDITERRNAEREMSQLATVVEQSTEMVAVIDTEGAVQYVNPAFERFTGYARHEIVGRAAREIWPDINQPEVREEMRRSVREGNVWHGHFVNARKDGSQFDEEAVISPVRDASGRITNFVIVSHDISLRLEMERHLREAQKLDGIGHLAGGVAHDFNNILAAMIMQIGVLFDEGPLAPEVAEGLREIETFANRAAALTRQLLLFSRKSVIQKAPLDLNETLKNLLRMLLRILGEDITVKTDLTARLPLVQADPGMMEQVIMNLSVNARDAMEGGGELRFGTRTVVYSEDDVRADPRRRTGTFVCLEVTDTGTGMDETTMARIFEPFFTTKGVGRGTGLGLATTYGIVAQHGGFIDVESRVGEGSTFRVYLPAREEGPSESAAPASVARPIERGSEAILLVEDDASVRRTLENLLTHAGYRVTTASSGAEALVTWDHCSGQFDLLFTDMVMPGGMSGLDLARKLRAGRPDLPVVVTSGYSADLVTQGDLGALGIVFLKKPSRPADIAAAVRKCLSRAA